LPLTDVGVAAWEGVVCVEDGPGESCRFIVSCYSQIKGLKIDPQQISRVQWACVPREM
jgi:hypothetical protein